MKKQAYGILNGLKQCNPKGALHFNKPSLQLRNYQALLQHNQYSLKVGFVQHKKASHLERSVLFQRGQVFTAANTHKRFYGTKLPDGIIELPMPSLSPSPDLETSTIVEWKVKEGDKIIPGDVLASVETDKATAEFENQFEGYVAKILVPDGTTVKLGTTVALLAEKQENIANVKDYVPQEAQQGSNATKEEPRKEEPKKEPEAAPSPPASPTSISTPKETAAPVSAENGRTFASPLAKKTATEKGVDINAIGHGTGPNNRIIRADVEEYLAQGGHVKTETVSTTKATATGAPSIAADYVDIPVSNIRKVIANRLLESKTTIPHYYLTVECQMDSLLETRSQLNKAGEKTGEYKLSVNDFIIKAAALASKKVPQANSSWRGNVIRQFNSVDVSVAVQTESGLITPIIFGADKRGISDISNQVKSLAKKARDGKLAPHEFQGGTFTVSNLGMYGVKEFSAIINPPQACILAVGGTEKKVVVNSDEDSKKDNPYKVVTVMRVTLSCDHRVIDGAVGAQWLQTFKQIVENPSFLML